MKLKNKYYIMRHGQAISNVEQTVSCWPEKFYNPLTEQGEKEARKTAKRLVKKNIDLIFCSPLLRTRQTASIVGKKIKIIPRVDKRLKEQDAGVFNGDSFHRLTSFFGEKDFKRFKLKPKNGETYIEIKKRMVACIRSIDKKYNKKNILIVSHELPLLLLDCAAKGISNRDYYSKREKLATAGLRELN